MIGFVLSFKIADVSEPKIMSCSPVIRVLATAEYELPATIESLWLNALPMQRRASIASWPDRRDRQRSLIASRLLSLGLGQLGLDASLASLRQLPRAKPTLDLPVDFSVSHCRGRIACAVSTAGPVGIDVEVIDTAITAGGFALYLDRAERDWAGDDARRFALLWTRKEAVAKAAGRAGMADLPAVHLVPDAATAQLQGEDWSTCELRVGRRHVAHLARQPDSPEPTLQGVSRRRLLSLVS